MGSRRRLRSRQTRLFCRPPLGVRAATAPASLRSAKSRIWPAKPASSKSRVRTIPSAASASPRAATRPASTSASTQRRQTSYARNWLRFARPRMHGWAHQPRPPLEKARRRSVCGNASGRVGASVVVRPMAALSLSLHASAPLSRMSTRRTPRKEGRQGGGISGRGDAGHEASWLACATLLPWCLGRSEVPPVGDIK